MLKRKKISFIVLTWKSISYISSCLRSVEKLKSFFELETIVVDNGSNDGTLLKNFTNTGIDYLGFEPAESVASEAMLL